MKDPNNNNKCYVLFQLLKLDAGTNRTLTHFSSCNSPNTKTDFLTIHYVILPLLTYVTSSRSARNASELTKSKSILDKLTEDQLFNNITFQFMLISRNT